MSNIMYRADGRGNWWRTEWRPQCSERVYLTDKCQGTEDHKGEHWAYGPDGSYHWSVNKMEKPDSDIACGSTPPDHLDYKNPTTMSKRHHLRFRKTTKVTDKAIIVGLEKDRAPEKLASIDRPVDMAKLDPALRKKLLDRMKPFKK